MILWPECEEYEQAPTLEDVQESAQEQQQQLEKDRKAAGEFIQGLPNIHSALVGSWSRRN